MFRIFFLFLLSLQIFPYLQAQNLVNNPGFENIQCLTDELHCGDQQFEIKLIADHWWSATNSSPDIFSPCNIIIDPIDSVILCQLWGVPKNWLGSSYAHSGQNYAGYFSGVIFFKDTAIIDEKEFIQVGLKELLKPGKKYCTGLHIKQAFHYIMRNNKKTFFYYLTDQTGIYFSKSRLFVSTLGTPQITPQVILKSEHNQYIAADTSGWERVYAPYTAAGGETWLTIGNFTLPAQMVMHLVTNKSQAHIDSTSDSGSCRHYIDDVEVIEIPELEAKADTNSIYKGNRVWLYSPTQAEEYTWFAGDTLDKIGSGDSLRVNPTETTIYYLKALQCKLTTYDTITITVLPTPLIPVNISVVNTLTNSEFTIKYIGDNRPELQAELFNSVGQIVRRLVFTETMNVGISDLATGIYYCRIRKDNVPVLTQKIVKMR